MVVLCNGCFWVVGGGLVRLLGFVWCWFCFGVFLLAFCLDLLRRARGAILVCGLRVGFSALG